MALLLFLTSPSSLRAPTNKTANSNTLPRNSTTCVTKLFQHPRMSASIWSCICCKIGSQGHHQRSHQLSPAAAVSTHQIVASFFQCFAFNVSMTLI